MEKQEKAITLITVVITIIILLLLAGVTLGMFNNQGILVNAETAVDMSKVNAMKNEIKMQIAKAMLRNDREITIEEIIERLEKQEIITDSNVLTGHVKTQPDGYAYEIKEKTNRRLGSNIFRKRRNRKNTSKWRNRDREYNRFRNMDKPRYSNRNNMAREFRIL